jgi:hypothetical protein
MKIQAVASALVFAAAAASAATPTLVYDGSGLMGNQSYGSMLGLDFTVVASDVTINLIGVFDSGSDGLTSNLTAALYDVTAGWTPVIAPVSFAAGTASSGGQYIVKSVAPVTLQVGHVYSVQAVGFNVSDPNYNTNEAGNNNGSNQNVTTPITFNTFGGKLSSLDSRYSGALGQDGITFFHSSAFGAATVGVVPEPETYALMFCGLGALALLARRRRS